MNSATKAQDPQTVYSTATAFDRAARLLAERFAERRDPDLLVPLYVNAAFAAEVYLKCLHLLSGRPQKGHKLHTLFASLPDRDQLAVKDAFDRVPKRNLAAALAPAAPPELVTTLEEFLQHVSATFEDWRYAYEKLTLNDASGLPEFAEALRARIDALMADPRKGTESSGHYVMTKIKVKCPNGHEFYMQDYERKACPKCGRVVVGPKAK